MIPASVRAAFTEHTYTEYLTGKASLLLYRHMECADFGRCDFKLTDDDRAVLIEINPRPGLTKGGPFENCAKAAGKTYVSVLGEIIGSARKRYSI